MTEITPKTPVAATPPTVELVADLLTEADNDLHDGYDWKLHIGAAGGVVGIGVEPFTDDGTLLPEQHYTAVVVEGERVPLVLDRAQFRARVEDIVSAFSTALATSVREMYPYHLARLKGALWDLAEPGDAETVIARVTAQEYHASRDDVTGKVELRIGGPEGTVVIDLGEDGDEILAGLLDIGQDFEDDLDDEGEDVDPAETCGDCETGRCHGDGPCGCARHDVSVRAGRKGGVR